MCAPTGPIQLLIGPAIGAATLNDGSCGEYESKLSARMNAKLSPTKPTSSFSRLFSVGERIRTNPLYPERATTHPTRQPPEPTHNSLRPDSAAWNPNERQRGKARSSKSAHKKPRARPFQGLPAVASCAGAVARSPSGGTQAARLYQTPSTRKQTFSGKCLQILQMKGRGAWLIYRLRGSISRCRGHEHARNLRRQFTSVLQKIREAANRGSFTNLT